MMPKHNNLPGNRKRWALHQREVARLVGVSRSVVSRYESGVFPPGAHTLLALEVVFGKSGGHLFPLTYAAVHEAVMRRAVRLDRTLAGLSDPASEQKRKLLREIVKRGGSAPRA